MILVYLNNIAFIFILNLELNNCDESSSKVSNLTGLPLKGDVVVYLRSIERIVQFCESHKHDIDTNLYLGLFLLNVNLQPVMNKKKVPINLKASLKRIVIANGALLKFFLYMVVNIDNSEDGKNSAPKDVKNMTLLFNNMNSWVRTLKGYATVIKHEVKLKSKKQLVNNYSSWNVYLNNVNDYVRSRPNPEQSDSCMVSLARNPSKHGSPYRCFILDECYDMIGNGTKYGYGITHRLLMLLAARFSRGCYVYSPRVDEALVDNLCTTMHSEAQYIAANNYKHVDLLLEQMSLCSLVGYTEFLQRSWLNNILRHQTTYGCYGLNATSNLDMPMHRAPMPRHSSKQGTPGGVVKLCDSHVSAVAAATLGAVVRYIIESYY